MSAGTSKGWPRRGKNGVTIMPVLRGVCEIAPSSSARAIPVGSTGVLPPQPYNCRKALRAYLEKLRFDVKYIDVWEPPRYRYLPYQYPDGYQSHLRYMRSTRCDLLKDVVAQLEEVLSSTKKPKKVRRRGTRYPTKTTTKGSAT